MGSVELSSHHGNDGARARSQRQVVSSSWFITPPRRRLTTRVLAALTFAALVLSALLIARPAEPVQAQSSAIWSGTLTVETVSRSDAGIFGSNFLGAHLIFGSNFAGPDSFEYNGSTVSVNHLYTYNAPPDFDDPDPVPTPTLRFGISPPSASTLSNTLFSLALDSSVFCFNGNEITIAHDGTEGIAIENHGLSWSVGDTVSVSLTVVTDCAAPPPGGGSSGALVEKEIWSAEMHPGERSPAAADYLITGYRDCLEGEDNCTPIGSLEGRDWFELDDLRFNVKAVEVLDIGERAVRLEFDADASMANSLLDRSRLRLYVGNVGYALSSGQPFYTGDRPAPLFSTYRSYRLRLVELVPAEISIAPGKSYIWTGEAPRFTREGVPIPIVWEGQPVPFMLRANGDLLSDLDVTVNVTSDLADPFGIKPGEHTVTMQGGWSWEYFELPTKDDDVDGKNGYVTAEVTPVEGSYTVVDSPGNMASLAVADNDLGKASLMELRVTPDVPYITEGQYAEFTFTANQAQPWDVPFRFEVTAGGDQRIPGGIIRKTITIPAGQTSATYRFGTTEYFRIGTGGYINVELQAPYPYDFDNWYSVHTAYDHATVAVSEAHGSKPTVHVSVNSYGSFATTHPLEITEGEIARFVVTILPGAPSSGLTVKWDAASLTDHLPDCPPDSGDDCKDNRVLPMTTEIPGNGFSQVVEVQTAPDRRACTGSVYLYLSASSDYLLQGQTEYAQVQIRDQNQQDGAELLPLCPGKFRLLDAPPISTPVLTGHPGQAVQYSFSVQSAPLANAGPDRSARAGQRVTLDGTGSFNPSGTAMTHQWTQVHGPEVELNGANRSTPSFTVPANAANGDTLIFKLTVTDSAGASSSDEVVVTVSAPPSPTACAGPDLTGAPGETVTLQGRCSKNPSGKWHHLAHAWTQLSGTEVTLNSVNRGDPSFTIPANATDGSTMIFRLTVADSDGRSDSDTVVVTVDSTPEATPPTACAGDDLEAQPGDTVTLQGICSTNPHGVWWRMSHLWTQPAGQNIVLANPTKGKPSFTMPSDAVPGTVYTFTLTVTDKDGESDSDDVTVTVPGDTGESQTVDPPPNGAPVFNDGIALTRSIAENSAAGTNVGAAITATDPDGDAITYSLSGTDAASFGIGSQTGQITTIEGITYDFEAKNSYSLTVNANDGNGGTAAIAVTVTLTDVDETPPNSAPVFDDGSETTRSVAENSVAGTNVGAAVSASDPDSDTLEYSLSGTDSASFEIDSETGQLTTKSGVTYDFEAKNSYSLTVEVDDGNGGSASIAVTVTLTDVDETPPNSAPVFDDGSETTRSIAENSVAGTNVGAAISASDPDSDTLEYSLSSTDAASFEIDSETGQLTTKSGVTYDFEAKNSYSLTVEVDDGNGGTASIAVTVTLTEVDETPPNSAPVFDDGSATTRSVAENSAAGTNVGTAISASDPDSDTLEYSLSGTDSASFEIDSETGQITTKSGVTYDFEAKNSYSLTVEVDDGNGGTASIAVTVTLTDVDETPPATQVTACYTNLGTLSSAVDYAGSWDDAGCKAHHEGSLGRYFHFTLTAETDVTISLSAGTLYVSQDTPNNGWGKVPGPGYEHRVNVRTNNGKLVHSGVQPGENSVTLTLSAGTYTAEAAGASGDFAISISPQ